MVLGLDATRSRVDGHISMQAEMTWFRFISFYPEAGISTWGFWTRLYRTCSMHSATTILCRHRISLDDLALPDAPSHKALAGRDEVCMYQLQVGLVAHRFPESTWVSASENLPPSTAVSESTWTFAWGASWVRLAFGGGLICNVSQSIPSFGKCCALYKASVKYL